MKFNHNINELSSANVELTALFAHISALESESIVQESEEFKKIVNLCLTIQDDLLGLDILERNTQHLKERAMHLKEIVIRKRL